MKNTPQRQSVSLSSKQTDAFGRAIAFVFFTPATKTAQLSEQETPEQVTLTPQELNQIIQGLQAILQVKLPPNQQQKTRMLLSELQQQQETKQPVTLSSNQTQQLRTLIGSLKPQETAALEILLLTREAPETINLTQAEINDLIPFFQGLPNQQLSTGQQQQKQELINFLTQLQPQN